MHNEVVDPHLTATIVGSYVRHHTVEAGLVSELITSVHGALAQLGRPNQPQEAPTPAVSVRQSVRHDYVVCLDCGYKAKMLQRHISTQHGLSRDEYLLRWGLRSDHSLTAPAYSEQRSTLAKKLGLGHRVKAKAKKAGHATAPMAPVSKDADPKFAAKPGRRGSGGSTSKSDFIKEAAGENIPASPRQSRSRNNPAAHRRVSRSSSPRRRRTQ
jgi:predicted transcriptional regulator